MNREIILFQESRWFADDVSDGRRESAATTSSSGVGYK